MDELLGYRHLFAQLYEMELGNFADEVRAKCETALQNSANRDFTRWRDAIDALHVAGGLHVDFNDSRVSAVSHVARDERDHATANESHLRELMPWRKGPFLLDGIAIDTEWRSDMKWNRIANCVDWSKAKVLDVGCGNGYFGWRMLGAGAELVLGLDPFLLYVMQHAAVRKFVGHAPNFVVPAGDSILTERLNRFDIVVSMGVLYHRTSPIDHLQALGAALRPEGTLILETLVLDGPDEKAIVPAERYAKMRNVWFLPSVPTLCGWLKRCGYRKIRHLETTPTTLHEQRRTDWMAYESLEDFLDPNDSTKTIEGYPAPMRAVLTATK